MRLFLLLPLLVSLAACGSKPTSDAVEALAPAVTTENIITDATNGFGYESLDPAFTALVDTKASIDILASGFQWSEGPVWVPALNSVLFSDVPNNIMYRWGASSLATNDEKQALPSPVAKVTEKGTIIGVDTFLYPSGYVADPGIKGEAGANGLLLDADGKLWLAQHGERQVATWEGAWGGTAAFAKTSYTTIVDNYQGKKFNSPNDLALAGNGDLYFTDPTYGVDQTFGEEARELDVTGVYRVKSGTEEAELLYSGLLRPNGVVMTNDQKHFIISSSEPERSLFMKCDASPAPMVEEDRCKLFADVTPLRSDQNMGNCDGMVMHPSGVMLATGPGGVLCFSESGKHLGTIRTGRPTANVTLGGPDGKDVFITANQLLLRARLN
ncbi:MAG: SMP-30/gluconolactonase/LRE family protein [Saprospiraceae bacterium]